MNFSILGKMFLFMIQNPEAIMLHIVTIYKRKYKMFHDKKIITKPKDK